MSNKSTQAFLLSNLERARKAHKAHHRKPHLAGAVTSCTSVYGWWYWGGKQVFGPFLRRDDARDDRRARIAATKSPRFPTRFFQPLYGKAAVYTDANGVTHWQRDKATY